MVNEAGTLRNERRWKMSRTYEIGCVDCARRVWVGQKSAGGEFYLYTDENISVTAAFLMAHRGHELEFLDTEELGQRQVPLESVEDETVEHVNEGPVEAMARADELDRGDYAKYVITRLRHRFELGFVQNPGGGEFTRPGFRCQVPLHDPKEDLAILVGALKRGMVMQ